MDGDGLVITDIMTTVMASPMAMTPSHWMPANHLILMVTGLNNADTDDDGDGVEDASDAFPLDLSETVDTDSDGIGNNADEDDDGDVADSDDAFPLDESESLTLITTV